MTMWAIVIYLLSKADFQFNFIRARLKCLVYRRSHKSSTRYRMLLLIIFFSIWIFCLLGILIISSHSFTMTQTLLINIRITSIAIQAVPLWWIKFFFYLFLLLTENWAAFLEKLSNRNTECFRNPFGATNWKRLSMTLFCAPIST